MRITLSKFSKLKKTIAIFMVLIFVFIPEFLPTKAALAGQEAGGTYIIKLKDTKDYSRLLLVSDSIKRRFIQSKNIQFQNIYTFNSNLSLAGLKNFLAGTYEYIEPQKVLQVSEVFVNDPGFTLQEQNVDKQWGLVKAGFSQAWAKTVGSDANVVAIIDTGIDGTHEDLQTTNFVSGFNFISNQPIAAGPNNNSDDNGHGTLVAGVLGAATNNGMGVAGTNWEISLMALKALDKEGKGDVSGVAEAIVWATDHGAQFVNLSLGGIGFGHDTTLANSINYAFNKNVLIVAAAGNDTATTGSNLDQTPVFPVCDDNNFNMIIGVAATDHNDLKPAFSNYGKNCIDVTAPGKRILSTINFDPLSQKPSPNSYAYASGTSLAVPFVVGQAALIKALYPQATNIQIRDRIIGTADTIDNLNLIQCAGGSCRGLVGAGRINVFRSLQTEIPLDFIEWDIVKVNDLSGVVYQIVGGQKRLISSFVYNQRFANSEFKTANFDQLANFPEGPYVTPQDGTLVKYDTSPTVYIMDKGQKLPITAQVFFQRKLSFADVRTLSVSELDSWAKGNFYPPAEGTLLKAAKSKTVYWVVGQVLHPINNTFYADKGLKVFPLITFSDADIASFPKGEAYIR